MQVSPTRPPEPVRQIVELAKAMFNDLWNMRLAEAQNAKAALTAQARDLEGQIEALLDRIVTAGQPERGFRL